MPNDAAPQALSDTQRADPQLALLKTPPHSIEAEQSVLGGLMLDNDAWLKVADLIGENDFYRTDHQLIYHAIGRLTEKNRPADVITVAEEIDRLGKLEEVGGLAYLGQLVQSTPSAANIRRYAEIVHERYVLRELAKVGNEIADSAYNPDGREAEELLDTAEAAVFKIAESGNKNKQGFMDTPTLLTEVVERIDMLYHRDSDSDVTGIATGFADLDARTSGLQPGDLIIVAGRPSMGKAQPLDAAVRTQDGWQRMGDLKVGDRLASVDGAPSEVTGIFPQGERQVFRVTFSDGRQTECCAEHLWRVWYREWDAPRVLDTETVLSMLGKQRYRNRLWIDLPTGDFGHADSLPVDPWVLGALLGDGSLSGTAVRFSTAADEMLARLSARVDQALEVVAAGGYDYRIVQKTRGKVPGIANNVANPLKAALEGLGLWDVPSHEKFIPRCYLDADRDTRLNVLRGLLDTDGWVERWGSVRFTTTSIRLALDMAELVRSLGGWCSTSQRVPSFRKNGVQAKGRVAYTCHISHPEPRSLLLLSDKQARLPECWQRQKRLTFQSIEPTRVAATQCISVSHPSRLYLTDQYVVTHNTAFAINVAENVAVDSRKPVAVFSMEMGGAQLVMRMIGSVGRLDQHKLRTGKLDDDDWPKLTSAVGKLHEAPIYIDETGGLSPIEVRARCRRLMRDLSIRGINDGQLGLVVIDYLQLMKGSSRSAGENRATEISEISRSLKGLAKELHVPVIALSQLSRAVEQRPDKRPMMSDLRESGAIEQDADVILFMFREEYYFPEKTEIKGQAEVIIGKQRNGPVGRVRMTWMGQYTRFENFAAPGGGFVDDDY